MTRRRLTTAAMALAAIAGCTRGDAAGCEDVPAGVEHVVVTGEGAWSETGVQPRLEEIWRVGGLAEEQHFGFPVHAVARGDGVVAVPDFMLGELIIVGPDGEWSGGVLGRVPARGDRRGDLAVLDLGNGKHVLLDADLSLRSETPVEPGIGAAVHSRGELLWAGVHASGAAYVMPGHDLVDERAMMKRAFVLRHVPGMPVPDTLAATRFAAVDVDGTVNSPPAAGALIPTVALAPDGSVAVAGQTAAYRIDIHDAAGRHLRSICRADAEPLPWSDGELGRADVPAEFADVRTAVAAAPLPALRPALGRVLLDADGRLWVQRDRVSPLDQMLGQMYGTAGARWDVFSADARYLGEIRAPAGARLQSAAGDRVWAFLVGELDETWLVAYHVAGLD